MRRKMGRKRKVKKIKMAKESKQSPGRPRKLLRMEKKNNEQRSLNVSSVEMTIMPTPVLIARRLQLESNKTLKGGDEGAFVNAVVVVKYFFDG
jgi:hypothetical protein